MLEYAEFLTTTPSGVRADWVDELRSVGWCDENIIHIVHVVALFNYMCRIADGLGVDLATDRAGKTRRLGCRSRAIRRLRCLAR